MNQLLIRRSELVSIAVALAMLLAIAIFSSLDWIAYRQNLTEVTASRQIFEDTNNLLLAVTDAESAQRGFLLTGNERYLAPYNSALRSIPTSLDQLERESADDNALHARVRRLRAAVTEKLSELQQTVDLRRQNQTARSLSILDSGQGAAMMQSIRQTAGEVRREAGSRISRRSQMVRSNSTRSHLITVAGSVVLLVLLGMGAVNIVHATARREQLIATLDRERRQASEVRDLLKTTLFSIGDAVLVTDKRGHITCLNRAAEALTGWREREAEGRLASEVFRVVHETSREPVPSPIDGILSGKETEGFANHTVLVQRDGAVVPIDDKAAPITTPGSELLGAVLVFRDITQRRAAERERERLLAEAQAARQDAERQRSHLHSLFLQAPASINIYRGPDHVFELLHPLAKQFFMGRDVTGLSARTVHREGVISLLDEVYRSGEPRNVSEFPLRVKGRDNGEGDLYVNYFCCPWRDTNGAVAGVMTLGVDVTEQVAIKRAMQSTEERLRETAKLESLGVLAGGIAHDFNNLLVGIIGNASLALEITAPGDPTQEMIDGIIKAGERAAVLTRQMLAYSGKGRFVIEMTDISGLVSEMLPLLKGSIPRSVTLQTQLANRLPPIEADTAQIQQVFMNLVINAAESCGDRAGTVRIASALEEVDEHHVSSTFGLPPLESGHYVALEVTDTGAGMDEETKARIFDPFFTTKFTGRGLGLSAVLGIVRSHKGAIRVYSEPGQGSTFKVLFPAAGRHFASRPNQTGLAAVRDAGTVLLIDDEEMVRRMGRATLERQGYRVLEAGNGEAAMNLISRQMDHIDLVVLDLMMPVMSGADTLAELRRVRPGLAVIISSGFSRTEAVVRFGDHGFSGFLQKPYTAAQLAEAAQAAISGARPQSTAQSNS